jgi:hypothetical protein
MIRILLLALVPVLACSSRGPSVARQDPPPPERSVSSPDSVRDAASMVPPGLGTLRQDQMTIALRRGPLLVKVTPLDEAVIRLAAPDTYDRLHALAENRRPEAARLANIAEPELFMISFFSYEPNAAFQPEDLQLSYQGKVLRAAGVIPLTPGWGKQLLGQQETQSAIYAFVETIDPDLPLTVRYGIEQSDAWTSIARTLEIERAKVRSRT